MPKKVLIIGAGPIGLEAALACHQQGHEVTVIERGNAAENIRQWGHVTLFSPFEMNSSARGRAALAAAGHELPQADAIRTGEQFRQSYLLPLAKWIDQRMDLLLETTVEQVTRNNTLKGDYIGNPARLEEKFRVLFSRDNTESTLNADVVLDCSGTFGNHNWCGSGGIPCVGERPCADRIRYDLPDIHGVDQQQFAGKTTLVIGSGYSAATNVVALGTLAEEFPSTKIIWATRHNLDQPMQRISNDSLPVRDQLSERANAIVAAGTIDWRTGLAIESIETGGSDGELKVIVSQHRKLESFQVNNIIANVGYKPDRTLYEELQIHECYATSGPMKLAAALLGETSADCLAQASPTPNTLMNPEPKFYILGAKSYGRNSRFLMKSGLEQIENVLALLTP